MAIAEHNTDLHRQTPLKNISIPAKKFRTIQQLINWKDGLSVSFSSIPRKKEKRKKRGGNRGKKGHQASFKNKIISSS
jgi:hypothetical protein